MFYTPTVVLKSVMDIDKVLLDRMSVKGLILDVDNTLTTHGNPNPSEGVAEWIKTMLSSGIKLCIVSNNKHKRIEPFAKLLNIPFVSSGAKPFTVGYKKAVKIMKLPKENIAAVGDQLFTDIWGGNAANIKTIYVFPIQPEKNILFKFKRLLEKPFMKNIRKALKK